MLPSNLGKRTFGLESTHILQLPKYRMLVCYAHECNHIHRQAVYLGKARWVTISVQSVMDIVNPRFYKVYLFLSSLVAGCCGKSVTSWIGGLRFESRFFLLPFNVQQKQKNI